MRSLSPRRRPTPRHGDIPAAGRRAAPGLQERRPLSEGGMTDMDERRELLESVAKAYREAGSRTTRCSYRSERLTPSLRLHSGLQALDRQSVPQRSASPLASVADLA
jgi:hypothetical protein